MTKQMQILFLIALAGAFGTLTRYGLISMIQRFNTGKFPWGTLIVNIIGCFIAGILWSLFENKFGNSPQARTVITIGFLGALTTFSTLVFETGQLMKDDQWLTAMTNVMTQNVIGIFFLFVGAMVGRWV